MQFIRFGTDIGAAASEADLLKLAEQTLPAAEKARLTNAEKIRLASVPQPPPATSPQTDAALNKILADKRARETAAAKPVPPAAPKPMEVSAVPTIFAQKGVTKAEYQVYMSTVDALQKGGTVSDAWLVTSATVSEKIGQQGRAQSYRAMLAERHPRPAPAAPAVAARPTAPPAPAHVAAPATGIEALSANDKAAVRRVLQALKQNQKVALPQLQHVRELAARANEPQAVALFDAEIAKAQTPAAPALAATKKAAPEEPVPEPLPGFDPELWPALWKATWAKAKPKHITKSEALVFLGTAGALRHGQSVPLTQLKHAKTIGDRLGEAQGVRDELAQAIVKAEQAQKDEKARAVAKAVPPKAAPLPKPAPAPAPVAKAAPVPVGPPAPVVVTSDVPAGLTKADWDFYKSSIARLRSGRVVDKAHLASTFERLSAIVEKLPNDKLLMTPGMVPDEWRAYFAFVSARSEEPPTAAEVNKVRTFAARAGHTGVVKLLDQRLAVLQKKSGGPAVAATKPAAPSAFPASPGASGKPKLPTGVNEAQYSAFVATLHNLKTKKKVTNAALDNAYQVALKTGQEDAADELAARLKAAGVPVEPRPPGLSDKDWQTYLTAASAAAGAAAVTAATLTAGRAVALRIGRHAQADAMADKLAQTPATAPSPAVASGPVTADDQKHLRHVIALMHAKKYVSLTDLTRAKATAEKIKSPLVAKSITIAMDKESKRSEAVALGPTPPPPPAGTPPPPPKITLNTKEAPKPSAPPTSATVSNVLAMPSDSDIAKRAAENKVPPGPVKETLKLAQQGQPEARAMVQAGEQLRREVKAKNPEALAKLAATNQEALAGNPDAQKLQIAYTAAELSSNALANQPPPPPALMPPPLPPNVSLPPADLQASIPISPPPNIVRDTTAAAGLSPTMAPVVNDRLTAAKGGDEGARARIAAAIDTNAKAAAGDPNAQAEINAAKAGAAQKDPVATQKAVDLAAAAAATAATAGAAVALTSGKKDGAAAPSEPEEVAPPEGRDDNAMKAQIAPGKPGTSMAAVGIITVGIVGAVLAFGGKKSTKLPPARL